MLDYSILLYAVNIRMIFSDGQVDEDPISRFMEHEDPLQYIHLTLYIHIYECEVIIGALLARNIVSR